MPHVLGRSLFDDFSVVQHRHARGHVESTVHQVRHDDRCCLGSFSEIDDQFVDQRADDRIKALSWFIEKNQFRLHDQGTSETDALEAANKDLPTLITRHSFMARLFHWVQAAAMFTLLFTAFLPIVGVKFAWVEYHWIAGLVLTGSIIYHIIHAIQ